MIAVNVSNPEINFKRVAGGWVFRGPNPWVAGVPFHYLVSDEERTRIIGMLARPNLAPAASRAFIVWCVGVATVLAYGFRQTIAPATGAVVVVSLVALPVLAWTIGLAAIQ